MFSFVSKYITAFLIKKGIKKAIKDTVVTCLNANIGLGCVYYTVLPRTGHIEIQTLGTTLEYVVIIDYDSLKYHIVKDKIIVFQGNFKASQNPVDVALNDFSSCRNLTNAIEGAALGLWEWFDSYVDHNWLKIINDITVTDAQGLVTAHEIRVRVHQRP